MAENLDSPSFGNFSIENTMEMGLGNQELLSDLFAPETSTANPDDLQDIKKDEIPPNDAKKVAAPKAANVPASTEDDTEKKDAGTAIQDFLLGGDSDDESTEEETEAPVAKTTSKEQDNTEDEEGEEEVSRFTALSKDLFKLGVFSKEDDEADAPINTP